MDCSERALIKSTHTQHKRHIENKKKKEEEKSIQLNEQKKREILFLYIRFGAALDLRKIYLMDGHERGDPFFFFSQHVFILKGGVLETLYSSSNKRRKK
jgi:hypothetical protein